MRRILNKILKKTPSSNQDGVFFEKITKILGFKPNTEIYYQTRLYTSFF
jgi:ribonuclease III